MSRVRPGVGLTGVPGDTNRNWDVFVRDRVRRVTERVSVGPQGRQGTRPVEWASISGDGRYVAFDSLSPNLVAGDTNRRKDVFVRDRVRGVAYRVSVGPAVREANGSGLHPDISEDGAHVAFASEATDLVPAHTNNATDVVVWDALQDARVSAALAADR